MEKELIRKRIEILEVEADEMNDRGYSFSVFQVEEEIERLKKLLKTTH